MVESAQFCGFGIKSALPTGCSALEVRVESFWLLPVGFNTLTVHLTVDKAAQYIEFLKQAFDAVELTRSRSADGRLLGHRFSSAVVHPKRRTDWLSRLGGTAT